MSAALVLVFDPKGLDSNQERLEAVTSAFPTRVHEMRRHDVSAAGVTARVWSHEASRSTSPARHEETGSWLIALGNPSRPDLTDLSPVALSERLLSDCLAGGILSLQGVSPPFAAVFHDGRSGITEVLADRVGLQHLYLSTERDDVTWVSSSSLALATGLGAEIDSPGVAEWLAVGHFVSQRTHFRAIRKLSPGERLEASPRGVRSKGSWTPTPGELEGDAVSQFHDVFAAGVAASATGDSTAVEITGGLDSRLVLAEIQRAGIPFFAWTLGRPGSSELRTVERLRAAVPFKHHVADVTEGFAERLPDLLIELHRLADGEVSALEYAPLLGAFESLEGIRTTSVSGSGGENARGYYYGVLDHDAGAYRLRGIPVHALVKKITRDTGQLGREARAALVGAGQDPVEEAVEAFVSSSTATDAPRILDDFYLRARMQRFGGRNISTTGMFCRQGLPYFANDLVDLVFRLPTACTAGGRIVRETLCAVSPELAAVPLDSGLAVQARSGANFGGRMKATIGKGRKGVIRYGGSVGRRMVAAPPDPIPWSTLPGSPRFRDLVNDLLLSRETRVGHVLPDRLVRRAAERGLRGRSMYELGLLLTLELSLRQTRAR